MERWKRVVVRVLLAGMWAVSLWLLAYPARAQAQGGDVHIVGAGETLKDIARQYDTDVWTLIRLNDLENPDLLYAGQRLYVEGEVGQYQPQPEEESRWQPPAQQNAQRESSQQNSYPAGVAWEPESSQANYPRAGVGWEPEAAGGGHRRAGVSWEPQPSEENNPRAGQGWESQPNERTSQRAGQGWEPEASEGYDQPAGVGWEPQPDPRAGREVEASGEKWIEVDLSEQSLTAYQGDTVIRVFVISSGSEEYPTVTGTFYTNSRFETDDMSGGSRAAGDYYFQADVPWVQYFYDGYAIHGAYWHNRFGTPIGHGCINMRVEESRWLYDWTATTGIRVEVHQ